jgi:hypothetical protein
MATVFSDTQTAITADTESAGQHATTETLNFAVDVTVATAGTLDIVVEFSVDGTNWAAASTPDAFTQIATTVGVFYLSGVPARGPFVRLAYTAVTGPYTFSAVAVPG